MNLYQVLTVLLVPICGFLASKVVRGYVDIWTILIIGSIGVLSGIGLTKYLGDLEGSNRLWVIFFCASIVACLLLVGHEFFFGYTNKSK